MTAEVYNHPDKVPDLYDLWTEAERSAAFHSSGYRDYTDLAGRSDVTLRIVVSRSAAGAPVIAPFTLRKGRKSFSIGEKRLFSLPVQTQSLYSQWLMQNGDADRTKEIFRALETCSDYVWIDLGEIPLDSPVHKAIGELDWRWIVSRPNRKLSMRWLIDLPDSFDAYLQGLAARSRQSIKRKMRKLEKNYDIKLEVISEAGDVERFLREGEKISRKTYQWNVGQRLINDAQTRTRYISLCENNRLRCYLLSADGEPAAFLRGTIDNCVYHYETPGFDPAFRKDSIGAVLLMYAIRDLIENTDCRIFDFGAGGDDTGYKSTFGNRGVPCACYELGRRLNPYANIIAGVQFALNQVKNAADFALRHEGLRQSLKRAIRQYGDAGR